MRRIALLSVALAFALSAAPLFAHDLPGHLVLNGDLTASVETADGASQQLHGRTSAHLVLPRQSIEGGARVVAFNVVLFGADQQALTGRSTRGKPTGVVGFAVATKDVREPQELRYDPESRSLVGRLEGQLDVPQVYEMVELGIDPENDYVELPTMPATLEVRIPVGSMGDLSKAAEAPVEMKTEIALTLAARGSNALDVRPFELAARSRWIEAQVSFFPWIEVARRLCVQPVGILTFRRSFPFPFPFFFSVSGDGLAFGQPGAATQWAKADIVFTYRDWIILFAPQFSTFSSDEASDLLSRVDVDDCIEVFFVDRFSPQTLFGGGATFGLGVASSKVISSDENADFGVDLTHLAHELGHVLDLVHPTGAPGVSTNTLMCPSGFNNDNPRRNSEENEANASNPLLTFALKLSTPGPDCQVSADCGPCP